MAESNSKPQEQLIESGRWLELYGDMLYGYALKRVRDAQTAEDLVQETLLAGLKSKDSFAGQSTEQTWLFGILKNKVMDYFRNYRRDLSLDEVDSVSGIIDEEFIQSGPDKGTWQPTRRPAKWIIDPKDAVEQKEFWFHLNNCIEELDKRFALVFVLRELEELDFRNICNTLAISHTNLRVMLYRARKHLRLCLERNWIGEIPLRHRPM